MEMLFLSIWKMRQNIEFQKTRVTIQALLSQQGVEGKYIEKAFEDLRGAFFPFEKTQREEEISMLRKVLEKEVARGGLAIRPVADLTRATMKQKLKKGARVIDQRAALLQQGRLKPLDKTPFASSRRRSRSAS
jgi:hypothetical protein